MCRWVVGGGHRGKAGKLQRQESWQAAATADVWGGGQVVGPRRELDVLWSEFSLIFFVLLAICCLLDQFEGCPLAFQHIPSLCCGY